MTSGLTDGLKAEDILSAHTASVVERASQQERVLLIQDTTELDYRQAQ